MASPILIADRVERAQAAFPDDRRVPLVLPELPEVRSDQRSGANDAFGLPVDPCDVPQDILDRPSLTAETEFFHAVRRDACNDLVEALAVSADRPDKLALGGRSGVHGSFTPTATPAS